MPVSLYIGLMSGTSLDGIDIALVDINDSGCQMIAAQSAAIDEELRAELMTLCVAGDLDPERIALADVRFGEALGQATVNFLDAHGLEPSLIRAIGSHGQTIRHRPSRPDRQAPGFSWQIGDPNIIAERSGITTVADFRRRDVAAGGQGAPLVPAFHAAMFGSVETRAVLNIGGMANISLFGEKGCSGFDVGPGNVLMDAWHARHRGGPFDQDGQWAASGEIDTNLLLRLLAHPFLASPPPKSTGREEFNLFWLDSVIRGAEPQTRPEDVQATLLEFTALSAVNHVRKWAPKVSELYVCGGGAHNRRLIQRIVQLLPSAQVASTALLGIDPDWVEAMAFAWLAHRTLNGLSGNIPSVTGARHSVTLGAIYPGARGI